jgi:hypothetical protein
MIPSNPPPDNPLAVTDADRAKDLRAHFDQLGNPAVLICIAPAAIRRALAAEAILARLVAGYDHAGGVMDVVEDARTLLQGGR